MVCTICDLEFKLLEHSSYLQDLVPSKYSVFAQLKKRFKGRKFSSNEAMTEAAEVCFAEQDKSFFLKGLDL